MLNNLSSINFVMKFKSISKSNIIINIKNKKILPLKFNIRFIISFNIVSFSIQLKIQIHYYL